MKHSFAPFDVQQVAFLSNAAGIDYSRVNFDSPRWLCISARDDAGKLMGLCCFEFVSWFEAYFNIAVRDPRCITRRVMHAMFTAVFQQAVRVTAEIEPGKDQTIALAQRMGFEIEGYKRKAIEGRRDALLLGMTADTCRFVRRAPRGSYEPENEVSDGKHSESA